MTIHESGENYLETIFVLSQDNKQVRSIDVASALNFSKPSISRAMKNLRQDGYIEIDSDGFIYLTESGREIAESMYERHVLISSWLISLGVDKQIATTDACRMEHVLSSQSFEAIRACIQNSATGTQN